jgi:RNA polymerase sigma-70 factor (ECF subfamily)
MRALTEPETSADEPILAREIQAALEHLPEEYRIMIMLADVEELSYKEIADVVGCPIGTVMSRLHRARKLMQKRLVTQAVQLGIITPQQAAPGADGEGAQPIALDAYRRRKEAQG